MSRDWWDHKMVVLYNNRTPLKGYTNFGILTLFTSDNPILKKLLCLILIKLLPESKSISR
jgi:hypothetical protein